MIALAAGSPAVARVATVPSDPASAYVAARAAAISGNHAEAAGIYARLASSSNDTDLRQRAVSEAISAGDTKLALQLIRQLPATQLSVNSKLLLVADALRRGNDAEAIRLLGGAAGGADLGFWEPLIRGWNAAERRNAGEALAAFAAVPRTSALAPFVDEQSALILLKLGRTTEAEPYARRAIGVAGPREYRVRLALAGGFAAAGDRPRALAMLEGISGDTTAIRQALEQGRLKRLMIDSSAEAFSEQLIALALEMRRSQESSTATPANIAQIARFSAPDSSSAAIVLGNLLADDGRLADALNALASVSADDPLKPEAVDAQARALIDAKRFSEALALAQAAVNRPGATGDDYARLGDVLGELDRHAESAAAYAQAVDRFTKAGTTRVWPVLLLQASALETAGRWPEAKAVLSRATTLAPNEPLILNFLGYAKLEHGEDLDSAEAMIRKASELAPDDASITDSLGWALYKRGRIDESIEVLQRAAIGDPAQAEIQEHLGDALFAAGRRFEARFAWQAALATAEADDSARIKAKIESGLTQATAAR